MKSIIMLGDSITFGRGAKSELCWANKLKKLIEKKKYHSGFNLGIPGDTSTGLQKRIETELKARASYNWPRDWHTIIIAIGINDTRGIETPNNIETKTTKFSSNINKIIKTAKKYSNRIMIVGLTPVDEKLTKPYENTFFTNKKIKEYNEIIKKVAKQERVPFVNLVDKINPKKETTDGLHPNKKGYTKMFKEIKNALNKHNLLKEDYEKTKSYA